MGDAADVALGYFRALSEGDVETAVSLIADGADFRSPMGSMDGKDAIRAFLGGFDSAFPGAHFDVEHTLEDGGMVAVEGAYRGVHGGPLMTPGGVLPATGRSVSAPFVTVFDVAGGQIRSHRPYWDVAGFMAQLTG
ncbi:MAG: nuclear transport factor 2 family protein [Acidimicrobiales bacterium]